MTEKIRLKYLYRDPKDACSLLNHAFQASSHAEPNDDINKKVFLVSVGNVLKSTGKPVSSIAERTGVSKSHIYRLMKGRENVTIETLSSLLEEAGITIVFVPRDK